MVIDSPVPGSDKAQVLYGLYSAAADGVLMVDDRIERIVEGEEMGYVPDSDEEDHEGISTRNFTEGCSIIPKNKAEDAGTKVVGMDKGPGRDGTRDQISLTSKVGELELDQDIDISLRCSQNSYSDKCISRVNRSRIRKLYNEVTSGAREEALCEMDRYIGSQEPGDLTQTIAMNVVDKFLCDNDVGSCQDIDPGKTVGSNSPPTLNVRGAQCFAKWANHRSSVRESRPFDWVESLADDDTGNHLSERMEFLSEGRGGAKKSHRQNMKPTYLSSGINICLADMRRKKISENVSYPNATSLSSPETPNSGLIPNSSPTDKIHISETETNNLFEVADAQFMTEPGEQQVEVVDVGVAEEMYDIGPNTQMAAEAMEALFHGSPFNHGLGEVTNPETVNLIEDSNMGMPLNETSVNHVLLAKKVPFTYDLEGNSICYKRRKLGGNKLNEGIPSSSGKYCSNLQVKNKVEKVKEKTKVKRAKWGHEAHMNDRGDANANEPIQTSNQDKECGPVDCKFIVEVDKSGISSNTKISTSKSLILGDLPFNIPVAPRTKQSKSVKISNWTEIFSGHGNAFCVPMELSNPEDKMENDKCNANISRSRRSKRKGVNKGLNQVTKLDKRTGCYMEVQGIENQHKLNLKTNSIKQGACSPPKRRRVHQITGKLSIWAKQKNPSLSVTVHPANILQSSTRYNGSKVISKSFHEILGTMKRKRRSVSTRKLSSVSGVRIMSLENPPSSKPYSKKNFKECETDVCEVGLMLPMLNSSVICHKVSDIEVASLETAADPASNYEDTKEKAEPDIVSSISKAQDSPKISRSRHVPKPSIARELIRLQATEPAASWLLQDPRRRKDMSKVRVLFSNHLDEDVIKQQKKILARFGVPIASSVTEATHFVTDRFARTKNMLEAMAMGKPVVTHMWLDSCAQTSYFIDEKNYVLRDIKKEKEIGFSMPVSLAHACQHPLLQGRRVLITPNVKPDSEVVGSLVKAAHGQIQPVESICKPAMKNDKLREDLLVISCEEDYTACTSLLDEGVKAYSSDLLLNGIIIQKLEFDRHLLFANHVRS